jgi:hypothetical protein
MALAWWGGVYVAIPRDVKRGSCSLGFVDAFARRREMASISRETRILAIINYTNLSFTLQCSSSRTVKSYIRDFVLLPWL